MIDIKGSKKHFSACFVFSLKSQKSKFSDFSYISKMGNSHLIFFARFAAATFSYRFRIWSNEFKKGGVGCAKNPKSL